MSRFFNDHYDALMQPLEYMGLRQMREQLLQKAKGSILEIGSGTGVNFPHYRNGERIVAIEPNRTMLEISLARAKLSNIPIEVERAGAEWLPFEDNAFDTVVGTLVLCTIPDPQKALMEIRRVSKPGAVLLLMEHVRIDRSIPGKLQDWLTPWWKRMCDGCHLNRNTAELVRQAGFQTKQVEWKFGKLLMILEAVNEK
ncbi:class I SAM-dependent methyltransferase [Paenibacillus contaminans]|uniref:SAM-dependent methyltransferase n=1 Tax=Paenibacillus contaminans TaxID=450362 RepID=A0A329LZ04_9BACL|nr:methyltransferase domain-containing protein [Paenibacillus contaminans]RAV12934.1 SAM-dependent methyltransferase [Paenibacillus contaminans]